MTCSLEPPEYKQFKSLLKIPEIVQIPTNNEINKKLTTHLAT